MPGSATWFVNPLSMLFMLAFFTKIASGYVQVVDVSRNRA